MTALDGLTKCVAGECQQVCFSQNADCNGLVEDGCETSIGNDKNNCGGCGIKCDDICVSGECGCKDGVYFADSNACKLTDRDNQNCGACGNVCPPKPHGPPPTQTCVQGTCNDTASRSVALERAGD